MVSNTTESAAHGQLPTRTPDTPKVDEGLGKSLKVEAAKGVPFFTPEQSPAPGTALEGPAGKVPRLFTPLKIRGVELPNRIWVSPMCQYSSSDGFNGPWHDAHYGGIIQRGVSILSLK